MAKTYILGKVKGEDAKLNGVNDATISGTTKNGKNYVKVVTDIDNGTITVSSPELEIVRNELGSSSDTTGNSIYAKIAALQDSIGDGSSGGTGTTISGRLGTLQDNVGDKTTEDTPPENSTVLNNVSYSDYNNLSIYGRLRLIRSAIGSGADPASTDALTTGSLYARIKKNAAEIGDKTDPANPDGTIYQRIAVLNDRIGQPSTDSESGNPTIFDGVNFDTYDGSIYNRLHEIRLAIGNRTDTAVMKSVYGNINYLREEVGRSIDDYIPRRLPNWFNNISADNYNGYTIYERLAAIREAIGPYEGDGSDNYNTSVYARLNGIDMKIGNETDTETSSIYSNINMLNKNIGDVESDTAPVITEPNPTYTYTLNIDARDYNDYTIYQRLGAIREAIGACDDDPSDESNASVYARLNDITMTTNAIGSSADPASTDALTTGSLYARIKKNAAEIGDKTNEDGTSINGTVLNNVTGSNYNNASIYKRLSFIRSAIGSSSAFDNSTGGALNNVSDNDYNTANIYKRLSFIRSAIGSALNDDRSSGSVLNEQNSDSYNGANIYTRLKKIRSTIGSASADDKAYSEVLNSKSDNDYNTANIYKRLSFIRSAIGEEDDSTNVSSIYGKINSNASKIADLVTKVGDPNDTNVDHVTLYKGLQDVWAKIGSYDNIASNEPTATLYAKINSNASKIADLATKVGDPTDQASSDTNETLYAQFKDLIERIDKNRIFGFEIDQNESDPFERIHYIGTNLTYRPARMVCEGSNKDKWYFDYGDWADVWFIKKIKVVEMRASNCQMDHELDPNDYNYIKGTKGTDNPRLASTVIADGSSYTTNTTSPYNVMVGIPTVWMKNEQVPGSRKVKVWFSPYKVDDTWKAYAHTKHDGTISDYTYIAAFNGSFTSNGALRSLPYMMPSEDQTFTVQRNGAFNNWGTTSERNATSANNPYDIDLYSQRCLINLLLMLIGRSTDTQATFGQGRVKHSYKSIPSGGGVAQTEPSLRSSIDLMKRGLFWGNTQDSIDGVKVFGIENWWGNVSRRTVGLRLGEMENVISIGSKMTWGNQDGSVGITGYGDETGAYKIFKTVSKSEDYYEGNYKGYIDKLNFNDDYGFIPPFYENEFGSLTTANNTTYYADYFEKWNNNEVTSYTFTHACFGGTEESMAGAFCCHFYYTSSGSTSGACLSCII